MEAPRSSAAPAELEEDTGLAHLTERFEFGKHPIQIQLRVPRALADSTRVTLSAALTEVQRIAEPARELSVQPTLLPSFPELERISQHYGAIHRQLAQSAPLSTGESPPLDTLLRAYAVDRAADILWREGSTDFLISTDNLHRARGSQAPGHTDGWRVALPASEGSPGEVLVLQDRAVASHRQNGTSTSVVAAQAMLAWVAALSLNHCGSDSGSDALAEGLECRRARQSGGGSETPGFSAMMEPVGLQPDTRTDPSP
ncbi:MAG: hypothetical protein VX498_02995 [Myxococcota bacterium]|nr:hypothetical protein [Myxococcota bacterium]